ncbi:MAG: hypothetical protein H0W62_12945 [Chitinophagales bacterium]|nr:hypothetical protein [Chitinophagales bacterium]
MNSILIKEPVLVSITMIFLVFRLFYQPMPNRRKLSGNIPMAEAIMMREMPFSLQLMAVLLFVV